MLQTVVQDYQSKRFTFNNLSLFNIAQLCFLKYFMFEWFDLSMITNNKTILSGEVFMNFSYFFKGALMQIWKPFYMFQFINVYGDFQICNSVPLSVYERFSHFFLLSNFNSQKIVLTFFFLISTVQFLSEQLD